MATRNKVGTKAKEKPPKVNPVRGTTQNKGLAVVTPAELEAFVQNPKEKRRVRNNEEWEQIAFVLVQVAKQRSRSLTKKEYANFRQLILAAAIATDKAYGTHKEENTKPSQIVFQQYFDNSGIGKRMHEAITSESSLSSSPQVINISENDE